MSIDFSWDVPDGFEISPSSASLSPKQSCKLTATFKPRSAIVYSASAVCMFSSELDTEGSSGEVKTKSMKVEGVGKYPHIAVKLCRGRKIPPKGETKSNTVMEARVVNTVTLNSMSVHEEESTLTEHDSDQGISGNESVVDFGEVAVGSVMKKRIEITNVSPVSLIVFVYIYTTHQSSMNIITYVPKNQVYTLYF